MEGSAEPLLRVRDLGKSYGEQLALRGIGFDLHPRELVAVVGPNGAGKTTLLSILAGIQRASTGTVSGSVADTAGRHAIGWAPQQPALYTKLSVLENLRLFARLEKVADPHSAVAAMLEQTGLNERRHELVERLSGGNRQRVNVALGLIADPRVLLLDEPTSALDPGQRARLWEFVGALAQRGTSVLFSTHHLGELRRHATRVIVLSAGELLLDGPPRDLVAAGAAGEQDFEEAFLALLRERGPQA